MAPFAKALQELINTCIFATTRIVMQLIQTIMLVGPLCFLLSVLKCICYHGHHCL